MKPIIIDMKEMSDSREVYESRPNPFMAYFIYALFIMLVIALTLMYFLKIDIEVKSNGMFKYDEQIVDVSSGITGKIKECCISDGQYVKEGDILLTINTDSIEESAQIAQTGLDDTLMRIEMLKAYQDYLDGNTEYFEGLTENKYYAEFDNRRRLLEANVSSSDSSAAGQKVQYQQNVDSIVTSISGYQSQLEKLKQAESCVKERKNTFTEEDGYYNSLVESYISNYEITAGQYDKQIKEYEKSTELGEAQADTIETANQEKKQALESLELQQLSSIQQQIESVQTSITSLQSNLASAKAQLATVSETSSAGSASITIMTEKSNIAAELLTYENNKTEYENTLISLELQTEKSQIRAEASGYVSFYSEVTPGTYIQEGSSICKILPETENSYYAEIYVGNADIAKLNEGQAVKLEIAAYPSSEYGYFTGRIDTIAKDIKVDSNSGSAYYTVKVLCDKTTVTNKQGDTGTLMNGMACQAKVVIDEESVLRYLLEKIDLAG